MRLNGAQMDRAIADWYAARGGSEPLVVLTEGPFDRFGRANRRGAPVTGCIVGRVDALKEDSIVEKLDVSDVQLSRIFCDFGILVCTGDELVIVELAPGVSAAEMQSVVGPTLKITHEVSEMVVHEVDHGLAR
jgi:hypothetical protein